MPSMRESPVAAGEKSGLPKMGVSGEGWVVSALGIEVLSHAPMVALRIDDE